MRYLFLSCMLFCSCAVRWSVVRNRATAYPVDSSTSAGACATEVYARFREAANILDTQSIAHTELPFTFAQPESLLGNWLCEAMLVAARTQDPSVSAALAQPGCLRQTLMEAGSISRAGIKKLVPESSALSIITLRGRELQRICDYMALRKGWPVAGIRFRMRRGKAVEIAIAGIALDTAADYTIAVNDFLLSPKSTFPLTIEPEKKKTGILLYQAMLDYLTTAVDKDGSFRLRTDQRIDYAE